MEQVKDVNIVEMSHEDSLKDNRYLQTSPIRLNHGKISGQRKRKMLENLFDSILVSLMFNIKDQLEHS